jgi:CelD/BcsL family acetyltransferase involved in cellulose biosynthesis
MHDLGSPAHAPAFFSATVRAFGGRARVLIVRRGGEAIGGLVALAHGDTLTVPWASCLPQHFALCPNMLLYWDAIRSACAEGFRAFDFGRSTINSGTYRFKRQWGALEQPLFWYSLPLSPSAGTTAAAADAGQSADAPRGAGLAPHLAAVWRVLPLAVTRRVGPVVRKYLVQ